MRHFIYIMLLSGFCLQFVFGDFYVLKEYDSLYTHYQNHKQCFGDSFYNFVEKHYGAKKDNHTKTHHDENHKVPFSTHSFDFHHFVLNAYVATSVTDCINYTNKSAVTFYQNNCHKWLFYNSLLQPPKNVIFTT